MSWNASYAPEKTIFGQESYIIIWANAQSFWLWWVLFLDNILLVHIWKSILAMPSKHLWAPVYKVSGRPLKISSFGNRITAFWVVWTFPPFWEECSTATKSESWSKPWKLCTILILSLFAIRCHHLENSHPLFTPKQKLNIPLYITVMSLFTLLCIV